MAKKKKRKNSASMDFYGTPELLQKMEKAGGNLEVIIGRSIQRSMVPLKEDMLKFAKNHHVTGATEDSMTETPMVWKNGVLIYQVGFDMKNGGIAALYLDVGTPSIRPYSFIYHTVERNIDDVKKIQQKALEEALKELM